MPRKFKFLGTKENGEVVGKNFGRFFLIKPGQVIDVPDNEADAVASHPEFEEVIDKKAPVAAAK